MGTRSGSRALLDDVDYRPLLTSEHLAPLWAEAAHRAGALEPSDPDWWRWRTALSALVAALQEAEGLAARVEPALGRRVWSKRPPAKDVRAATVRARRGVLPRQVPGATL